MPSLPSSLENLDDETKQRFRDILAVPMKFDKPEEETILRKVVEEDLTEEEVDAIACISYAYWVMKKLNEPCVTENNDMAKKMAMKVARWHMQYLGTKDCKAVTKRLKDVVQIRKVNIRMPPSLSLSACVCMRVRTPGKILRLHP